MPSRYSIPTLVVGGGAIVAVVLAAAFVALHVVTAGARQSAANLTGTVQIGADGDSCLRFVIDNKTGFIRPGQGVDCREPAKDSKRESAKVKDSKREGAKVPNRAPELLEPRYSNGARIDAVRDSFYKR
jgi:hypothetical protein